MNAEEPEIERAPLILLSLLSTVAYAVLLLPGAEPRRPARLAQLPGIERVVARPPSLFVDVERERWRESPREERLRLVQDVAEIARASGYRGAQLRTSGEHTVGQWLERSGARLVASATPR